jgi:AdoMet-dependent heme synthase
VTFPLPGELNYEEAVLLIDEIADIGTPVLIFSGGDCLKRPDLPQLIHYAKSKGLRTGAIPAVTPLLTADRMRELMDSGLDQIAFSLDAATAKEHDSFRRVEGVFERTLEAMEEANRLGMHVQINSLVNVHNENQLTNLFDLIGMFHIVFWEVFFLVPTGRGQGVPMMDPQRFETAFEKIYSFNQGVDFIVKITEAPHYRRFCRQQESLRARFLKSCCEIGEKMPDDFSGRRASEKRIGRAPEGVNSGKGFAFVSSQGDVMPSGFLPISAGNIRRGSLSEIYRNSTIFKDLRNTALLKGRCGQCPFKSMCGGSRARAFALTGDYLEEDPCCAYQPPRFS